MTKKILTILAIFVAILVMPFFGRAEVTTTVTPLPTPTAEQIATLNRLYAQITALRNQLNELKAQAKGLQTELRLTKKLSKGMNDEEVKTLQELLSTDSEIYPEGLVTGYYGSLTEKAVHKLQKKAGLVETGQLDDRTIWKINELLKDGAGRSGKIPPGLLRAPGILRKLGLTATTTPPGGDTISPIIISLTATSTTASTTLVVWQTNEPTTGIVHYATSTPVDSAILSLLAPDSIWQTNHQLTLADLSASTTYYYYLVSADFAGNHATSTTNLFTTLGQ